MKKLYLIGSVLLSLVFNMAQLSAYGQTPVQEHPSSPTPQPSPPTNDQTPDDEIIMEEEEEEETDDEKPKDKKGEQPPKG